MASFATVFVFWGLTPSQAGIFASSAVNRTTTILMAHSTSHLSLAQQAGSLSSQSANSVSSIRWLNETLQPYMTRDAALAPFGPLDTTVSSKEGLWTGDTWQYFANVSSNLSQHTGILRGTEALGQTVAWAMQSEGNANNFVSIGLNFGITILCIVPTWIVLSELKESHEVEVMEQEEDGNDDVDVVKPVRK